MLNIELSQCLKGPRNSFWWGMLQMHPSHDGVDWPVVGESLHIPQRVDYSSVSAAERDHDPLSALEEERLVVGHRVRYGSAFVLEVWSANILEVVATGHLSGDPDAGVNLYGVFGGDKPGDGVGQGALRGRRNTDASRRFGLFTCEPRDERRRMSEDSRVRRELQSLGESAGVVVMSVAQHNRICAWQIRA